jgi:L-iditol 2-dehydrogenase
MRNVVSPAHGDIGRAGEPMRVAVYYSNSDIRVEERPVPSIGPGEVLVKTEACGLCGGEAMEWYLMPRAPKILGHEPAGVIVEVGKGVTGYGIGDRVFVHHHVSCNYCRECQRGAPTYCSTYSKTNIHPGGFADYFRVPAENVPEMLKLPENMSFEEASVIEPMSDCLYGIQAVPVVSGDTIAIQGVGFMGLCFVQLARLYPYARVVALDFSDWRLERALEMGATHTINPRHQDAAEALRALNHGRLADAVVSTAPSAKAWEAAVGLVGKGGTLHVNAPPHPDERATVDPNHLYFSGITINNGYSSTKAETYAVLELMASGRVDARALVTHRFGLDGVAEGIDLIVKAGESIKSVIIPSLTRTD